MLNSQMQTAAKKNSFKERAKGSGFNAFYAKARKILIVDDEETVGIGMAEILKDAGFNAAYAVSGSDAVEAVRRIPCSLVFMDMMMPGMNGLETFRKIKELNPGVRVVLFTGFFKDVDKAIYQGVREGMIDLYIRKPFYAEEIINTAKKYA